MGRAKEAVAVRQYLSAGVSVTLIDDRPDEDGFGHPDAEPLLLREAARWLEAHPAVELTGIHCGFDPLGRRQLVVTAYGDPDEDLDPVHRTAQVIPFHEAP